MPLHLLKLCVGVESVEDLESRIGQRLNERRRAGEPAEYRHRTRMIPARRDEILDGGSLYWVIRGAIQARQAVTDIRPFRDTDGVQRCHFVMEPVLVPTLRQPRRAFQGWRYLKPEDAPADLASGAEELRELPPALRVELAELGLL